jgi:predicted transport protein
MNLYTLSSSHLQEIKPKLFKLEKEIQQLFESNLDKIMGLEMVKSEFPIKNKRIDTLAYDPQNKAFIIIEYKRDKNVSVIDQGFTYLGLMLENKADFIVEYNESMKGQLKRKDVDWSQSRVVFVSTGFTENQRLATNFKDIAIELWEVKGYENGLVSIDQIEKSKSAESIKPLTQQNQSLKAVQDEIKVYNEEDHYQKANPEIRELAEKLRDRIMEMEGIEANPVKQYIGFKHNKKLVCDFEVQKKQLRLRINLKKGMLDDPKGMFRDVSNIGTFGVGDFETVVKSDTDLDYLMSTVKQSYRYYVEQN